MDVSPSAPPLCRLSLLGTLEITLPGRKLPRVRPNRLRDFLALHRGGTVPSLTSLVVIPVGRTAEKTAGDISVASLTLNNGATLRFSESGNSLTSATVVFGNTGLNQTASNLLLRDDVLGGADLLITAGTNLSGRIGTIGRINSGGQQPTVIQNDGVINSSVANNTTLFNSTSLTNTNLIQATNGASLTFGTGNPTINSNGANISISGGGGTLNVQGAGITNNGTVTVTDSFLASTNYISGGSIVLNNATVNSAIAYFSSGAAVSGSQLTLNNGASLRFSQPGNTLSTTNVTFGGTTANDIYLNGDPVTSLIVASGTTLTGRIGRINVLNSFSNPTTLINIALPVSIDPVLSCAILSA